MSPECPEEFPYCIWHPDTASEATYRELAKRYPHMKYLVGRACAVAGCTYLFHELDLLPECHIAEEARKSGHMAIFDTIMKAGTKYNAMDDYTKEISTPVPGNLNGDTAVRSYLDTLDSNLTRDGCRPATKASTGRWTMIIATPVKTGG
ncbi:hypothetical protein N7463_010777 [Penicillium fimorum]|uniref:Uncharacterized protein n=1 Tax=Penicillium fimorum TaxID=1882269 RepID=A0A9W9XLF5_9EURO|nr:hypothetical protein N7463_010777 [Penicillium fimorum]